MNGVRRLAYGVLLGAVTLTVLTVVVYVGEGIDAYYRSRLVDMVRGTAYRPYVYRLLVPGVARLGTAALPSSIKHTLSVTFDAWTWRPAGWLPAYATEYVFVLLVMAASLAGFAAGLRRLFDTLFAAPASVAPAVALVGLACVPMFFGPFSRQIYDFTTLWLFTLGLALLAQSRWSAYIVVFLLASVNKETSILLTLVFVVHYARRAGGLASGEFRRLLAWQLIIFMVVRAGVVYAFRHNPGQPVEMHLFDHNQLVLLHPQLMSKRLPLLGGLALAGLWRWRQKPSFLRDALIVLAPVMLIMGITVGQVDEIRAYYEVYPVIVLLVGDSVCRIAGIPIAARSPQTGGLAPAHT